MTFKLTIVPLYHSDDVNGPVLNVGAEEESEDEYEEEEDKEKEEEVNDEPEPQSNEPQWSLKASETMLTLAQGRQTLWLRKRRILEVDQENLWADDGCEKTIEGDDLLCCNAPGCGLTVSWYPCVHCYNQDLPRILEGVGHRGAWHVRVQCSLAHNSGW